MSLVLAWAVLLALLATATVAVTSRSRRAARALLVLAVLWVLVNSPLEGAVLLTLSDQHGVTVADLLSVAAVGVGVAVLAGGRSRVT